jgi:hypothetical protein
MRKLLPILIITFLAYPVWGSVTVDSVGGPAVASQSIFDLMYSEQAIDAVLELNLDEVIANRKNAKQVDATFSFTTEDGALQTFSAKVATRGKYRRRICDLPPLKLDFKKEELKAAGLEKYDKYKLVTHCLDSEEGQENLIQEYLAYKFYNYLTEHSFRVQLLKLRYVKSDTVQGIEGFAMIIEETDEMAERIKGEVVDGVYNLQQKELEEDNARMHALFQFMIGNTDWSMKRNHNMKLVRVAGKEKLIAVPYDFDFSGLVDASYAVPNQNVGQKYVKERIYMGPYFKSRQWKSTFREFKSKRARILISVRKNEFLADIAKDNMVQYLNGFFHYIDKVNRP